MKLRITMPGVFDGEGNRVKVGTPITVKGNEIPANLLNKVEVIGKEPVGEVEEVHNDEPSDEPDDEPSDEPDDEPKETAKQRRARKRRESKE